MTEHYVDIISCKDDKTIRSLGPFDAERLAEKAEMGLSYDLNHDRFYTQIREES